MSALEEKSQAADAPAAEEAEVCNTGFRLCGRGKGVLCIPWALQVLCTGKKRKKYLVIHFRVIEPPRKGFVMNIFMC